MTCGFSSLCTEITLDSSINALSLLFSVSPAKGFLQLKNYFSEPSHLLSWEVFSLSPSHHPLYISKAVQNSKNPSFCLQFRIFFKKIPLSLSNQPEQFHLTLTLCFAFSHLRLCFIFLKPLCLMLDGSRTDATELCFISIFTLRQNSVFWGMVKIIS